MFFLLHFFAVEWVEEGEEEEKEGEESPGPQSIIDESQEEEEWEGGRGKGWVSALRSPPFLGAEINVCQFPRREKKEWERWLVWFLSSPFFCCSRILDKVATPGKKKKKWQSKAVWLSEEEARTVV